MSEPDPERERALNQRESPLSDLIHSRVEIAQVEAWSGPLPHPDLLQRYEEILPGAAERILVIAENQQRHQISQERKILEHEGIALESARTSIRAESRRSDFGMAIAAVIALAGLIGGVALIALDRWEQGIVLFLAPLTGLVGLFVYQSRVRRAERRRIPQNPPEE